MKEVIKFVALDKDNKPISTVWFLKNYYDNRRFDVMARALERFFSEIQSEGLVLNSLKVSEETIDDTLQS